MNNMMPSNPSISRPSLFQQEPDDVHHDTDGGTRLTSMFEQWQHHLKNCHRCIQRRVEGKPECGFGEAIRHGAETELGHTLTPAVIHTEGPVIHPAARRRIRDFFFKPRTAA